MAPWGPTLLLDGCEPGREDGGAHTLQAPAVPRTSWPWSSRRETETVVPPPSAQRYRGAIRIRRSQAEFRPFLRFFRYSRRF